MYRCPNCATVLHAAEGDAHAEREQGVVHLLTVSYHCPGCGRQYLHWTKEFHHHEPVDQWFHLFEGRTLLMHNPPDY